MDQTANHSAWQAGGAPSIDASAARAEQGLNNLSSLMENLEQAPSARAVTPAERPTVRHDDRLAQARLGIASGLYTALRAKDPPTAGHALRVALGCSAWSLTLDVSEDERDRLEIAALLHDVGKIGVPDQVLLKPGRMSREEAVLLDRYRAYGLDILRSCCVSQDIIDTVYYVPAWYDGSFRKFDRVGADLPVGSRIIAIVDAFDSMTSDHVWRRAMPRERAIAELFEGAGRQFDPELVRHFCMLQSQEQQRLHEWVVHRWLHELDPGASVENWGFQDAPSVAQGRDPRQPFFVQLVEQMHDAILFVDTNFQVGLWNQAAEQLTGIPATSVLSRTWTCDLVAMRDERGRAMPNSDCPLRQSMEAGMPMLRRLTITGRGHRPVCVNAHAIPVMDCEGTRLGAVLKLHDVSSETTLEERVQTLHEKATLDPLTGIANRAEFDRHLQRLVKLHLDRQQPCSLIICDLDHFKRTNDTFGHQAGDEVLTSFAGLLKRKCRPGDQVARYGGEEFVMLCAECDNATATRKAEEIRRELSALPHTVLDGRRVTASFGVTELQAGDTPATMFRRADRALYQAKDRGRNVVVQLGTGFQDTATPAARKWWDYLFGGPTSVIMERQLVTAVPMNVAVEKLRGFVADHHADIVSINDQQVVLKIEGGDTSMTRRSSDRPVSFVVEMDFTERRVATKDTYGKDRGTFVRTFIDVVIRPRRNRDRRRRNTDQRAVQILISIKSYLMAQELHEIDDRTRAAFAPQIASPDNGADADSGT
jgi:diguanylate cyclase (GGDEF)-like protein/PAS domain S-box-containing protein